MAFYKVYYRDPHFNVFSRSDKISMDTARDCRYMVWCGSFMMLQLSCVSKLINTMCLMSLVFL